MILDRDEGYASFKDRALAGMKGALSELGRLKHLGMIDGGLIMVYN